MATQSDDFNRASLGANGPNGNAWEGEGSWSIASSTVLQAPTTIQENVLVYNTTQASAEIECDILTGPASSYSGLCFRWTDDSNYLSVQWDPGTSAISIIKKVAGADTTVCGWTTTAAVAAPFNMKLRVNGNSFTLYINDVSEGSPDSGSASDSFNNTATRHGFWHFGNGTTGGQFDNWLLQDDLTVAVSDSDAFSFSESALTLEYQLTDAFTALEAGASSGAGTTKTSGDRFRFTERESLSKNGSLLLERPLYALIESNIRTAAILDYLETVPDDEVRETGIDVDI